MIKKILSILCRTLTDSDTVAKVFSRKNSTGVDNITDIAGTDGIQNFFAAFAGLMADTGADTVCLQKFACQRGGFNIKAHIVETADKRQRSSLSSSATLTMTVP